MPNPKKTLKNSPNLVTLGKYLLSLLLAFLVGIPTYLAATAKKEFSFNSAFNFFWTKKSCVFCSIVVDVLKHFFGRNLGFPLN